VDVIGCPSTSREIEEEDVSELKDASKSHIVEVSDVASDVTDDTLVSRSIRRARDDEDPIEEVAGASVM
jgi:hypothetical protein